MSILVRNSSTNCTDGAEYEYVFMAIKAYAKNHPEISVIEHVQGLGCMLYPQSMSVVSSVQFQDAYKLNTEPLKNDP